MSAELAEAVVEAEFGRPSSDVFASFDAEPFAAASIGQVHGARLHTGERVAVKVQYPGVADAMESDLQNAETFATFFRLGQSMLGGLAPRADVRSMTDEIRERLLEELDYTIEARNQIDFATWYRDHPTIRIPRIHDALSTRRVLTMDRAEGRTWDEARDAAEALRQQWAETIYRFAFGSFYRLHAMNADPHPGNYLFRDDGTVVFLDFGFVKRFPPLVVAQVRTFAEAHIAGDADGLRRSFVEQRFLSADDPLPAARIFEWLDHGNPWWRQRPFRFTPDAVATLLRTVYSPTREWRDVTRRMAPPKDHVALMRVDFGIWSVLASLQADNDWVAIHEEIWGERAPATALGDLEAQWRVTGRNSDSRIRSHPR